MSNNIEQLFALFDDFLDPSDVLHSKLMAQISSAIIKERLKLHMNQSDFASHIDVNQSLISRWEHGDYNFSLKKLAQIASKLDLDVNIIFNNITEHKMSISFPGSFCSAKVIRYSPEKNHSSDPCVYSSNSSTKSIQTLIQEELNYVAIR